MKRLKEFAILVLLAFWVTAVFLLGLEWPGKVFWTVFAAIACGFVIDRIRLLREEKRQQDTYHLRDQQ
jgi:hypothetical protein